jgi:hypothetical protein
VVVDASNTAVRSVLAEYPASTQGRTEVLDLLYLRSSYIPAAAIDTDLESELCAKVVLRQQYCAALLLQPSEQAVVAASVRLAAETAGRAETSLGFHRVFRGDNFNVNVTSSSSDCMKRRDRAVQINVLRE